MTKSWNDNIFIIILLSKLGPLDIILVIVQYIFKQDGQSG